MNNFINLKENDFCKSIHSMKIAEKESLQRLIGREISQAKEELNRYEEFLKLAKTKKNDLECCKNEQRIKDTELLVEQLGRKLYICQKEIDDNKHLRNTPGSGKVCNGQNFIPVHLSNSSLPVSYSSLSNSSNDDDRNSLPISTKSLIHNFERIGTTSTENLLQSKAPLNVNNSKKKPIVNAPTSQRKYSLKFEEEKPTVSFKDIKLKKVGLPPDALEVLKDTSLEKNQVISGNQSNQPKKTVISNGVYSFPKSSSVDLGLTSPLSAKNKFHNPNKDIQIAIQNEIKDLKLKKIDNNSLNPIVKCSVEEMSLGRFNFINEQSATDNTKSSMAAHMSISKSMPFLNSISTLNIASDEVDYNSAEGSVVLDKSELNANNINDCETPSSIGNWDPLTLLNELYDLEKERNEAQTPLRNNAKNVSGFMEMLPGLSNNSWNTNLWKRRFTTISNGELKIFENPTCRSVLNNFEIKNINIKTVNDITVELYDSRGLHSTIRFPKSTDCAQWVDAFKCHQSYKSSEIVPFIYDSVACKRTPKIIVVDIGSCSIRAGLLKIEPTLPKLYFPNLAAISRKTGNVVEIGFEAVNPNPNDECNIIRPFKPDTTIEDIAFTSGTVELTFRKTCSLLNINPKEYVIMLSLPHNVAEATRTKLGDVLLLRLNFQGVSMCGQSLLALHTYGEHTGILVDIGHRTEVLPVIHGIVQSAAVTRSLYGGHLVQIALSHLLPFEIHSLTDFLLARYVMEKACFVAETMEKSQNCNESKIVNLDNFKLPAKIPKSLSLKGRDRCLPVEGLFNPDIYHLDTLSLPKLIIKSIQSCPMDNRRDLCQSICLSGAASQFPGLSSRLERELKLLLPNNCDVKVRSSPNRAHFSYVGACFVALSDGFAGTIVNRSEWEDSRSVSLKKWNF